MRCTEFSEVYIKNIVYLYYLYTLYHPKNGIYIYIFQKIFVYRIKQKNLQASLWFSEAGELIKNSTREAALGQWVL